MEGPRLLRAGGGGWLSGLLGTRLWGRSRGPPAMAAQGPDALHQSSLCVHSLGLCVCVCVWMGGAWVRRPSSSARKGPHSTPPSS